MTTEISKDNTLKIRMDEVTFDMMEKARDFLKLDKSKFVRKSIRQMAEAVITEHDKTIFSTEDWHNFFAMIDNPPEPTERMKKAAKKLKEFTLEKDN